MKEEREDTVKREIILQILLINNRVSDKLDIIQWRV